MHTGKCGELTPVLLSLGPVKRSTAKKKSRLKRVFQGGEVSLGDTSFTGKE
jgi:hypothetical protein